MFSIACLLTGDLIGYHNVSRLIAVKTAYISHQLFYLNIYLLYGIDYISASSSVHEIFVSTFIYFIIFITFFTSLFIQT